MTIKDIPIVVYKANNPHKTVCDLKWNYPLFNFGRNEYRTCCRSPGNKVSEEEISELGINAFTNHPREIQQRLDLIQGKKINDCSHCWSLEDTGLKSPREPNRFYHFMKNRGFLKHIGDNPELTIANELSHIDDLNHPALRSTKPQMVEISLGNTCDMKCMYCNHHYSSQWAVERIKYGEILQEQYDTEFPKPSDLFQETFWQWFETVKETIHRIGIIGGEPLITPEFYPLLERLLSSVEQVISFRKTKITLFFVTNLNTNEKYFSKFIEILPRLTQIFNVEIILSQESIGKKAEYIRNGLNWSRFNSNVNHLLSLKDLNFDICFLPTINILSVSSLPDITKYIIELSLKYNRPIGIRQNIISDPEWQNPRLLTGDFSVYIEETIQYIKEHLDVLPKISDIHINIGKYIVFLEMLRDSINNKQTENNKMRKKFVEWFDMYDQRRKLNLLETFPEYRNFYEMCKQI